MSNIASTGVRLNIQCVKESEIDSEAVSISNAISFLDGLESAFTEIEKLSQNNSLENPFTFDDSLETVYYTCEDEGHFFYLEHDLAINNQKLQNFRNTMCEEFNFHIVHSGQYEKTNQVCANFDEAFAKLETNDEDLQTVIYALKAGFRDALQKVMENYVQDRWNLTEDSFSHGTGIIEENYKYENKECYIDMHAFVHYHTKYTYLKEFDSGMCTLSKLIFESDKELLQIIKKVENRILREVSIKEKEYNLSLNNERNTLN